MIERWRLNGFDSFTNLKQTGCYEADGIDDVKDFKATRHAMKIMEISNEEQEEVLKMVAAILHLGNMVFKAQRGGAVQIEENGGMRCLYMILML